MNDQVAVRLSAREELAAATQKRVMEALASVLRRGEDEVTFDLLAAESGVPVRTVYRHYSNKEALFSSFWRWVNDTIEVPTRPTTPEEVISHVPGLFASFDRDEPLVRAMLHNPHGRAVRLATSDARRAKFEMALQTVTEHMTRSDAQKLLAAVTALCSASGWETMKDNWGLDGAASAKAAQWAIAALIKEARGSLRVAVEPPNQGN